MAYGMIRDYGMSDNERIGQLAFPKSDEPFEQRPYSEATAQAMDEEAKKIVDDAYARVLGLLSEKQAQLQALAELLVEKETINHDDIVDCLGKRPFETNKQYEEFITARAETAAPAPEDAVEEAPEGEKVDKVPPLSPARFRLWIHRAYWARRSTTAAWPSRVATPIGVSPSLSARSRAPLSARVADFDVLVQAPPWPPPLQLLAAL